MGRRLRYRRSGHPGLCSSPVGPSPARFDSGLENFTETWYKGCQTNVCQVAVNLGGNLMPHDQDGVLVCEICEGLEKLPCTFCDGEGHAESQVDVDSFYPFHCTCDHGFWDCSCIGGVTPYEPAEPEEARKIRRKVMAGPWA